MEWRNGEQYQDYTAGEAMLRASGPELERSALLDDEGCRLLVEAVIRQALEDYLHTGRKKETEAFFRSEYFYRLTGLNGGMVLRMIRKERRRR